MPDSKPIPQILYKYRSLNEYSIKTLTDGEIYLPSISELNDPFEGSIPYVLRIKGKKPEDLNASEMFLFMLEQASKYHPDWSPEQLHQFAYEEQRAGRILDENHLQVQRDETTKQIDSLFGVFSLTSEKNNFLMWSHYADSHKGICIGFNSEILFNTVAGTLGPVTYKMEFPVKDFYTEDVFTEHNRLIATKGEYWEYEKEYRLTKMNAAKSKFNIPLEGIEEVIFGIWVSNQLKLELLEIIKKNIPNCKVFETKLSKKRFELDLSQIM